MVPRLTLTGFLIVGMRGNDCRERIAEVLQAVPGVMEVDVNLLRARAIIVHDPKCDPETLARAITNAGYLASRIADREQ